jgi:hypothetical protein
MYAWLLGLSALALVAGLAIFGEPRSHDPGGDK